MDPDFFECLSRRARLDAFHYVALQARMLRDVLVQLSAALLYISRYPFTFHIRVRAGVWCITAENYQAARRYTEIKHKHSQYTIRPSEVDN